MKKLIDMLNELAVAEAETDAIEEELKVAGSGDQIENRWDEAYKHEIEKYNEVVDRLVGYGIERKTARTMINKNRSKLVEIAQKEVEQ